MAQSKENRERLELLDWEATKGRFQWLSYPEKLKWWTDTDNVPLDPDSKLKIQFRLRGPAPVTYEFLTIMPEYKNSEEKQLFLNWLNDLINIGSIEYWESFYREKLEREPRAKQTLMIKEFKTELEKEHEENKENRHFEGGRKFAIKEELTDLYFEGQDKEKVVSWTISGYQNGQREIALDTIIQIEAEPISEQVTKTAGQKIAILYELGFIKTLNEMNLKPEQIGKILQGITGEKADTCRQVYNAIISDFSNKNNPFSEKTRSFYDSLYSRLSITPSLKGKPNSDKIGKQK